MKNRCPHCYFSWTCFQFSVHKILYNSWLYMGITILIWTSILFWKKLKRKKPHCVFSFSKRFWGGYSGLSFLWPFRTPCLTTLYYHDRGNFLYESSTNYSALVLTKLAFFNYYKKCNFFSWQFCTTDYLEGMLLAFLLIWGSRANKTKKISF